MKEHIKPEAGDVWEYKDGIKVYITMVDEETVESFAILGGSVWGGSFRRDEFRKDHNYLGHSKANIDDLFKTENEE